MRIFVRAKAKARETRVEKLDDTHFAVSVKEAPVDGKANRAIAKALAEYLGIPQVRVALAGGGTGRDKIFEIL